MGFSVPTDVLVIAGLCALVVVFGFALFAKLYRKAGPHEALVVYGFRGLRMIKGKGTVIFPMIENCRELSLELMSFDVAPKQDLYTKQGVAVTRRSRGADQGQVGYGICHDRLRTVPHQDAH